MSNNGDVHIIKMIPLVFLVTLVVSSLTLGTFLMFGKKYLSALLLSIHLPFLSIKVIDMNVFFLFASTISQKEMWPMWDHKGVQNLKRKAYLNRLSKSKHIRKNILRFLRGVGC
jgi:hypothetical protein